MLLSLTLALLGVSKRARRYNKSEKDGEDNKVKVAKNKIFFVLFCFLKSTVKHALCQTSGIGN